MAFPISTLFQNATTAARDDEKVSVFIRSSSAYIGMDVVSRLQACASSDAQHILQPQSGPHVAVIHQALETLASAAPLPVTPSGVPSGPSDKEARLFNAAVKTLKATTILPAERSQATYGPSTAKAVKAYKTAREIRRSPSAGFDGIVGILTIQTLDRDLAAAALGDLPSVDPISPGTKTPIDFVIAFIGGVPDSDRSPAFASDNLRLNNSNYKPLNPKLPNAADFVHNLTGRRLRCIGRGSTTPDSIPLFLSVVQEIALVLRDSSLVRAKLFIRGGSAGGRNALLCATRLSAQLGSLEMVAAMDAAFFAPQADKFPQLGLDGRPKFAPEFGAKLPYKVNARQKFNFFQTKQNRIRPSLSASGNLDWTSVEDNLEIHGKLTDFEPNNSNVDNLIAPNDGLAHANAVAVAERIVCDRIRLALGA